MWRISPRSESVEGFDARARRNVVRKMRRYGEATAAAALPETCPYTLEQILGDWEPEATRAPG